MVRSKIKKQRGKILKLGNVNEGCSICVNKQKGVETVETTEFLEIILTPILKHKASQI
jgi:lipopolysaccharide export system protein LptA